MTIGYESYCKIFAVLFSNRFDLIRLDDLLILDVIKHFSQFDWFLKAVSLVLMIIKWVDIFFGSGAKKPK